jgi:hypothetical protein
VAALELGGIALAARADFRRRLGETALATRVLSAAVAGFAVVFNWIGHPDRLRQTEHQTAPGCGWRMHGRCGWR